MSDLGFDTLTDDQIVEMARQLGAEINRRHPGVADAATAAIKDEIAKATQGNDAVWTLKRWLATMVTSQFGGDWTIAVWLSQDRSVVRVYLETPGKALREDQKWCLHVTGDKSSPPGHLTIAKGSMAELADAALVRIIARETARLFPGGVRIDCDVAAKTPYDIPAPPADYEARIEELRRKQDREEHEKTVRSEALAAKNAEESRLLKAAGKEYHFQLSKEQQDILARMMREANEEITRRMAEYDQEMAGV